MSLISFKVSKSPEEVLNMIKKGLSYELIHERVHHIEGDMISIVLVYEKYYMRNSSRAALTVTINNFNGYTQVESISAGSSQGLFFNIDWGAGEEFANSVKHILKEFIIE
ncbi:hypothetical protein EDC19_0602 [Natranaerovirga hydrolytica]|uniref:Uncharacterized protein n=1 Tax=Natranaerovirga hydrolytica TaxID=680378 RepID=A0A4R1N2F3_9FIRM|nr:DUF6054 family protein [Natranaerovirga hydrolytica]TCK98184.1 hypothetical protein EDC19_0602 [Natranaerovirga hydrolytica]